MFRSALLLLLLATGCGYNAIPTAEETAKAALAEVGNQYQRRADLVPNLVATVQGFADQERDVLVAVTEARSKASSMQLDPNKLTDPAQMARFEQAQGQLGNALGRLLVVVEKYPELKSNENFLALQTQLEGTENRITIARRDYNEAAREVNTMRRTFPQVIWANTVHTAEPFAYFQASAGAEQAPTVDFGSGSN
ncbi:MAG: LemA family protein [Myxococcales bacterium]|nr:LemA family protein [Myxococcales bacterium]